MTAIDHRTCAAIAAGMSAALRIMRRVILALAGLSCFSVTLGFMGLAMGLSEGAFLLFVTCASSIAGLALVLVANRIAAEREAGDGS